MIRGVVPALMQLVWMLRAGSAPSSTQAVWREAAFPGVGSGEEERCYLWRRLAPIHRSRGLQVEVSITHSLCKETCTTISGSLAEQRPKGWAGEGNMLFCSVKWMWSWKSWFWVELGWSRFPAAVGDAGRALPSSSTKPKLQHQELNWENSFV